MSRRNPLQLFGGMRPPVLLALCLILAAALGFVDYVTGHEISFAIFYLAPVGIASWFGGRSRGFHLALLSAMVWLAVDLTSGHEYSMYIIPFWNAAVRLGFFLSVAYLLAAQRRLLSRELENARIDPLTGVLNSRSFTAEARGIWDLAERHGHTVCIAFLDLDDFKRINDEFGHAEGDNLLKLFVSELSRSLRSTDILGRLGGDEFVVLLPETRLEGAEEVFRRVHENLIQSGNENGRPVTVSIGVLMARPPFPKFDAALRCADELMYRAKRSGKRRVVAGEYRSVAGANPGEASS